MLRPAPRTALRRRPRALACAAAFAGSVLCGALGCDASDASAPDIVLIVIDTARADHFGCYGYPRDTTPNLDAFARDAVLYRSARSAAPWTLPSHASIFTGMQSGEHGLHWSRDEDGPPSRMVTALRPAARERLLAVLLAERGYTTFGVSNNGWVSKRTGLDAGFQHFFLIPPGREGPERVRRWLGDEALPDSRAELSFDLFRHRLDAGAIGRPFFAFFNLIEPHFPYRPPPSQAGRFAGDSRAPARWVQGNMRFELSMLGGGVHPNRQLLTALYDEELATVDAAIGQFFDLLRARGLYDEALIVVTSDHGEHLGEGGRYSHQLSVADELLEVPLLIKYPGGAGAGTIVEEGLVSTIDVHQTVLATAWPDNPLAGGRSQNLGRMESFTRGWGLAEYYYSPHYLAQIKRVVPSFDPSPHEVVRRVVVTAEGAQEVEPAPSRKSLAKLTPSVRDGLAAYLADLQALEPSEGVTFSSEDLRALRALGYVE